jgi:hypothetical protein
VRQAAAAPPARGVTKANSDEGEQRRQRPDGGGRGPGRGALRRSDGNARPRVRSTHHNRGGVAGSLFSV